MSDHRVEDVEILVAAVAAGDISRAADRVHPDFEFRSILATAEGEVYRGPDGLRTWERNVRATWEDFRLGDPEVHLEGAEDAVVVFRLTGTARVSGVPLDSRVGQVWTWRDGRLWRVLAHGSAAAAYEAAGLTPP